MLDHRALLRAFADYARTIAHRYEVGDVIYRLSDQVVEVLGLDGAGVSIADADGVLRFISATDDKVIEVEEAQIELGEGPCQDAFHSGAVVTCEDLTRDDRWPAYTAVALDHGCLAVAGIPMVVEDQRIGALNLYARTAQRWDEEELAVARVLADMATGYVRNALRLDEFEQLSTQLEHALESRVIVEQAKGVLAERNGIRAGQAFEVLRRWARDHRRKIHEVAQEVVDGELDL